MPSTPTILLSLGHVLNVMDYSGKIVLEFQTGNKK